MGTGIGDDENESWDDEEGNVPPGGGN